MLNSRIFLNFVVLMYIILFYCDGLKTDTRAKNYQVILRKAVHCEAPQPPYPKKRPVDSFIEIYNSKGRSYVRGNSTVKTPVPFHNFSAQSYLERGAGYRELKFQTLGVSCRNILAATILRFANINYSKKNCLLPRGFYSYTVDVDKITHSMPIWHEMGHMVHHLQLVADKATILCSELHVDIQVQDKQ